MQQATGGLPAAEAPRRRWTGSSHLSEDDVVNSPMLWPAWSPLRRVFGADNVLPQQLLPPTVQGVMQPPSAGDVGPMTMPAAQSFGDGSCLPPPLGLDLGPGLPLQPPPDFTTGMPPACSFAESLPPPPPPPGYDHVAFGQEPALLGFDYSLMGHMGAECYAQDVHQPYPDVAMPGVAGQAASLHLAPDSGMQLGEGSPCAPMTSHASFQRSSSPRRPPGLTVFWVGERAFRAAPAMKEQVANLGYRIRIYRNHEKCRRAVEREPQCMVTAVFVVSVLDAEPLIEFLSSRTIVTGGVWFVIDASREPPASMARLQYLPIHFPERDGSQVVIAYTWEEIIATLGSFGAEAVASGVMAQTGGGCSGFSGCGGTSGGDAGGAPCDGDGGADASGEVGDGEAPKGIAAWKQRLGLTDSHGGRQEHRASRDFATELLPGQVARRSARGGDSSCQGGGDASRIPPKPVDSWTLLWITDNAFKPTSTWQRVELERLGGQLKGYKCQKNAARALDKKRAIGRCVVLVSFNEAFATASYLQMRKDLGCLKVVVEARETDKEGKAWDKVDGILKKFAESGHPAQVSHNFPDAVAAIRKVVDDAGWST